MGRRLRTTIPQTKQQRIPSWSYLVQFKSANAQQKVKQKENFDSHYRVHEPPEIPDEAEVWVRTDGQTVEGRVLGPAETPRSYIVETPAGEIRRNQNQLTTIPSGPSDTQSNAQANTDSEQSVNEQSNPQPSRKITTRSQTGVEICPPIRYRL